MEKYVEINGLSIFQTHFTLETDRIRKFGRRKKGDVKPNSFNNINDYNFVYYGTL